MKTKIKVIASCAFGVSSIIGCSAMAAGDGWSGTGSDSWDGVQQLSGVSCANDYGAYDYRIDCTGVSWLKYIADVENSEIQVVPRGKGTEYGTAIDAKCAKAGGFYHLGINFQGVNTPDDYFYKYTSQTGAIGGYVGPLSNTFINHSDSINSVYDIDIGTFTYTYRIASYGYWGHRYNTTVGKVGNDSYNTKDPQNGHTMTFGHKLYKNGKQIYHSEAAATDPNKIPGFYAAFLDNMCGSGSDGCKEQTDGCSYGGGKWTCSKMPSNVFAFCAYPIKPEGTKLKPQATIKIGTTTVTTDLKYDPNGLSEKTAPGEITVNSSTVSAMGGFDYYIEKEMQTASFTPPMSVAGSTISSPSFKFSGAGTHISDGLGDSAKTVNATLEANKKTKVCAETSSLSKINSTSTSGDTLTARACIYVKYVPIEVDVHSNTIASISGGIEDPKAPTTFVSGKDGSFASDTVYVKAGGDVTIKWGHYIGYDADTIRPQGSTVDKVWTNTYNIYGGGKLGNGFTISKYEDPKDDFKNYWWSYLNQNYPSLFNRDFQKNEETVRLFPGENYTSKQVLKHPKTVYANTTEGGNQVGEGTGESSVELDLKANDIECWFKNGDYDIKHSIGVDNPNDYRWLQITNNNGITKTVGDDISLQNDEFWLKPESQIQIIQTACFGSQIERDAKNKNGDRWTKNPWEEITDYSNNKLFELSGDLKDSIGSSLFDNATGASKTKSNVNASLTASEIGISNFSKVSNPSTRVANGYRIETKSNPNMVTIGNLGKSLNTSFSKPNKTESVSITTKIPYNYYMSLNLEGDGSNGYLTSESTRFTVNIKNEGRINVQVCNDTLNIECNKYVDAQKCNDDLEGCDKYKYSTNPKETTAGMLVFAISSKFSAEDLKEGRDSFSYNGNIFNVANDDQLDSNLINAVGNQFSAYRDSIQVIDGSHLKYITNEELDDKEWSITSDSFDLSDLAVGTKVCAVAAVYPSDSHDTGNGDPINDSVQSAAFSPTGTKTGLKVSCRTVAKHQNMSVEGNGVVTTQRINSSTTTYGGKIFRSWSEYQIISGGSGSNASSGAVTAYALNNTAAKTENGAAALSDSSVESSKYLYPQTLGNYSLATIGGKKSDPNSGDESEVNWRYSETLIKNIVDTYGTRNDGCTVGELPTSKNYLRCIGGGNLSSVNPGEMDTLVVRSTGTLTINNDSHLDDLSQWGNPKQLIIIAPSILIDGNVTKVNAWLIVDGGELNTCSINGIGATPGDENTLDNCNNPLIINGPVIVRSTLNTALKMPRTFGGGSKVNEKGEFVKDPETLVQRAEIFNYDPSVVEWAYRESQKNPHLETTYTETLAPRL